MLKKFTNWLFFKFLCKILRDARLNVATHKAQRSPTKSYLVKVKDEAACVRLIKYTGYAVPEDIYAKPSIRKK